MRNHGQPQNISPCFFQVYKPGIHKRPGDNERILRIFIRGNAFTVCNDWLFVGRGFRFLADFFHASFCRIEPFGKFCGFIVFGIFAIRLEVPFDE